MEEDLIMVDIRAHLELKTTDKQITSRINREIVKQLNTQLGGVVAALENNMRVLIEKAIKSQPEYQSLLGGSLQGELGVPQSETRLQEIVDIFLDSIVAVSNKARISGGKIVGGIKIVGIRDSYRDVLTSTAASYTTKKGMKIPWLQWLLLEGDITIVDYRFGTRPRHVIRDYSRTGLGLMFKKGGARWTMPPEFAGTRHDNFITRALAQVENQSEAVLEKVLARNLC
jgi:hypothetical protein